MGHEATCGRCEPGQVTDVLRRTRAAQVRGVPGWPPRGAGGKQAGPDGHPGQQSQRQTEGPPGQDVGRPVDAEVDQARAHDRDPAAEHPPRPPARRPPRAGTPAGRPRRPGPRRPQRPRRRCWCPRPSPRGRTTSPRRCGVPPPARAGVVRSHAGPLLGGRSRPAPPIMPYAVPPTGSPCDVGDGRRRGAPPPDGTFGSARAARAPPRLDAGRDGGGVRDAGPGGVCERTRVDPADRRARRIAARPGPGWRSTSPPSASWTASGATTPWCSAARSTTAPGCPGRWTSSGPTATC